MAIRKIIILLTLLLNVKNVFSQVNNDSVKIIMHHALTYLMNHQNTETKNYSFIGEWHSTMGLNLRFPLLGKAVDYDDSNCYTTAAIHNSLAKIYLLNPSAYNFLLPSIDQSYQAILLFRDSTTFNFWHRLPSNLKFPNSNGKFDSVRRPTTYNLRTKYIRKAANVMDDADDTAEGFMAILLHNRIHQLTDTISLLKIVNNYCDENRKNFNWWNYNHHDASNSGAYLTWLGDEKKLFPKSIVNTFLQNCIFFLPVSECYPKAYTPYMPYGTNDVDVIVNATILSFLAENNELDKALNKKQSVDFIYKKVIRNKYDRAAIYYPNRYQIHYATIKAYSNGVKDLAPSVKILIDDIKKTQQPDGSFESKNGVNHKDKIQSTAYALFAMLSAGNINERETKKNIEASINFLLNQKINSFTECYWNGGVFFSGGTVIKRLLFFKSDAFSTALIAQDLAIYLSLVSNGEW